MINMSDHGCFESHLIMIGCLLSILGIFDIKKSIEDRSKKSRLYRGLALIFIGGIGCLFLAEWLYVAYCELKTAPDIAEQIIEITPPQSF